MDVDTLGSFKCIAALKICFQRETKRTKKKKTNCFFISAPSFLIEWKFMFA